jgi:hypothetical protein
MILQVEQRANVTRNIALFGWNELSSTNIIIIDSAAQEYKLYSTFSHKPHFKFLSVDNVGDKENSYNIESQRFDYDIKREVDNQSFAFDVSLDCQEPKTLFSTSRGFEIHNKNTHFTPILDIAGNDNRNLYMEDNSIEYESFPIKFEIDGDVEENNRISLASESTRDIDIQDSTAYCAKLSFQEQMQELEIWRNDKSYLNAKHKCDKCVMPFVNKKLLVTHMQLHLEVFIFNLVNTFIFLQQSQCILSVCWSVRLLYLFVTVPRV